MTRATESLTNLLSTERAEAVQSQVSEGVEAALAHVSDSASRVRESESVDRTRHLARSAALAAARGTGRLSLFLGRQGASLAKKGYECVRTSQVSKAGPDAMHPLASAAIQPLASAAEPTEQKKSRKGRRIAIVILAGVAVLGGALVVRRRCREQPRVADAPPNLRDLEKDAERSASSEET